MSVVLKMADGDLYINQAGRSEEISGPSKVDQELFSVFATFLDSTRPWGAELDLSNFTSISSPAEFKALLYSHVTSALKLFLNKQASDLTITEDEIVHGFSRVEVRIDEQSQSGYFVVVADIEGGESIENTIEFSYRPTSIRHVEPPIFPSSF